MHSRGVLIILSDALPRDQFVMAFLLVVIFLTVIAELQEWHMSTFSAFSLV